MLTIHSDNKSVISINGKEFSGSTIRIVDNKIYVNGVGVEPLLNQPINVVINGGSDRIDLDVGNITVNGNVSQGIRIGTGDVECYDVEGDITLSCGDISCGKVTGNIKTSCGDISCTKE